MAGREGLQQVGEGGEIGRRCFGENGKNKTFVDLLPKLRMRVLSLAEVGLPAGVAEDVLVDSAAVLPLPFLLPPVGLLRRLLRLHVVGLVFGGGCAEFEHAGGGCPVAASSAAAVLAVLLCPHLNVLHLSWSVHFVPEDFPRKLDLPPRSRFLSIQPLMTLLPLLQTALAFGEAGQRLPRSPARRVDPELRLAARQGGLLVALRP